MQKASKRFFKNLLKALRNDYVQLGLFLLLWFGVVALFWLPLLRASLTFFGVLGF